jgi:mercuric ion binding protein
MKSRFVMTLLIALFSLPSSAATQNVMLSIPDMTCAACPITVKVALNKIEGVLDVNVSYPQRKAVVSFDNTLTSVQALTEATKNAGYPSFPEPNTPDQESPRLAN